MNLQKSVQKFIPRLISAVHGNVLHPADEARFEQELINLLSQPLLPYNVPVEAWPQEKGLYWFHGWQFETEQKRGRAKEFFLIRVVMGAQKKPIYICEGNFFYRHEAGEGTWYRAFLPEI